MKRKGSRSDAQRSAEPEALRVIAKHLNTSPLSQNHWLSIGRARVCLDGFSETGEEVVLVEINARIGRMKTSTMNKVVKDACKLWFVTTSEQERWSDKHIRKVLVFLDQAARDSFGPKSWNTAAFDLMGIERVICEMPELLRQELVDAQNRQDLRKNDIDGATS